MELRHLRTIAAVARHGSFSKAAEELHLAQSAVSQQIRRLETELGVEVFRRMSRSVARMRPLSLRLRRLGAAASVGSIIVTLQQASIITWIYSCF